MSQVQYEASGSEVSKVESDIAQTVNLADTVVNLIREPVVLLYQNISKKKALHASLGIWRDEALDDAGQCRIPVMLENGFEAHLVRTDGIIDCCLANVTSLVPQERRMFRLSWGNNSNSSQDGRSQTPPPGSACWAYFLHSLGIRPGTNVVGWRPSTDGYISTQNGGVEMEIDGSALCHIINLYSKLPQPDRRRDRIIRLLPNPSVAKSHTFSFGKLAWDTVNDQLHAHFTPGVETELNAAKQPFGEQGSFMEPGTMIASYLSALEYGTSDQQFHLPSAEAPLRERVAALNRCVRQIWNKREGLLLLTYDWLESASRIKRRLLTQGGKDRSFYEDIGTTIDHIPYDRPWGNETRAKDDLKKDIYKLFPFSTNTPSPCVDFVPSNPSNPGYFIPIENILRMTLEGYSDLPTGSWRRGLFDMKDEVIENLCKSSEVKIGKNVYVLPFTRSSDLWNEKVLLGAPVASVPPR